MFLVSDVHPWLSCLSHVKLRGGTRGQETERTHLEGWTTENFHLPGQDGRKELSSLSFDVLDGSDNLICHH